MASLLVMVQQLQTKQKDGLIFNKSSGLKQTKINKQAKKKKIQKPKTKTKPTVEFTKLKSSDVTQVME